MLDTPIKIKLKSKINNGTSTTHTISRRVLPEIRSPNPKKHLEITQKSASFSLPDIA